MDAPDGIEGPPGCRNGLGLLAVDTVLGGDKTLCPVSGHSVSDGIAFSGYEMHVGRTTGPDCARPLLRFADGKTDGAVSASGRIAAGYVHGLFAGDGQRGAWLARLGASPSGLDYEAEVESVLDRLAAHLAAHIDLDQLLALAR